MTETRTFIPCISSGPELAVVVPTFKERENVEELVARLDAALSGIAFEIIFVDDDSPDGTSELVATLARRDSRIRLLRRIGRRGLSSACIEGILSTTAPFVAVMDADLQHDESALPSMFQAIRSDSLDIVVATRNASGGSMGEFSRGRVFVSNTGRRISQCICKCSLSDPMSGFFLLRRSFFLEVAHRLHGGGFKILVDILSSATRPVRLAEIGFTFRRRCHGESKLNVNVAAEYFFLIIDKLTHRSIPSRFVAFALVGAAGVATHLAFVAAFLFALHWHFFAAQITATYIAMTENFFLNNALTWHDRSLRGTNLFSGLASFCLVCSFGAWANVVFAHSLLTEGAAWYVASIAGIVLSSVWNYSMANLFTWQRRTSRQRPQAEAQSIAEQQQYER